MLPYEDEKLAPRQRALDLLSRMTLREKVGQLTQRLYGFRVYERHGQEIALVEEFRQEVLQTETAIRAYASQLKQGKKTITEKQTPKK